MLSGGAHETRSRRHPFDRDACAAGGRPRRFDDVDLHSSYNPNGWNVLGSILRHDIPMCHTANIQSPPPPPEVRAMEVCDAHSITSPPQDALSIDTSPLRYPDPKAKWPHAWRDCLILEKKVYEKEERIIKKEQEDAARAQKVEDDHAKWLVTHTASHFK
jgi:hypothetical protein